ncbi:MAG: EAL domain-containing protein [Pseudomonadota bacterium]
MQSAIGEHLVQFYENDAFLIEGLTNFIGAALALGGKGIVIATKSRLKALEKNLMQRGLLSSSRSGHESSYIPFEVETLLGHFIVNDAVDESRFSKVIGDVIKNAATGYDGKIFVFGEMVAILCGEEYKRPITHKRHDAAIHVENCFNQLMKDHEFSLLCGYPMDAFPKAEDAESFRHVCAMHSTVIPTERYDASASIDELQRTTAILQQKAFSLTSELNQRLQIEQLLRNVNVDKLTGLPNRNVFQDRLEMEIRKAHRGQLSLALLFIDLDHFKEINDTRGHAFGDVLLKQVAQRLSASVREIDTVARLGGDEFTVILSALDDSSNIDRVAQNILKKLTEPFQLNGEVSYISASIGITLYPNDATSMGDLLKNADQAMYASKESGRNRVTYFTKSMQEAAQKRMKLSNELRCALAGKQLRVLYQPIVDLNTGKIQKAEALLRWQHPIHGLINPIDFIPIAEHTGMIANIGEWVFYKAARQAAEWRRFNADFQISVNVSPAQFQMDDDCLHKWTEFLGQGEPEKSDKPKEISLEITEGLLLDASTAVVDRLAAFRNAGIQVSLDDFGTGYSSLSYLRKFHLDYLKIDQAFVRHLETQPDNLALCEAIIVMAHKLGLKVIAEGVETVEQRNWLKSAECDYAQGYLFSTPVSSQDFEKMLSRSNS